jgi:hypothetical protein
MRAPSCDEIMEPGRDFPEWNDLEKFHAIARKRCERDLATARILPDSNNVRCGGQKQSSQAMDRVLIVCRNCEGNPVFPNQWALCLCCEGASTQWISASDLKPEEVVLARSSPSDARVKS